MPILKFQCQSCGLLQRKRVKISQPMECDCGGTTFPEGQTPTASVGFSSSVEGHMSVQASGIESFDMDFDRVIGQESTQKWDTIYRRQRDKWDLVQRSETANGYDIMRLPDGGYDSLPNQAEVFRRSRQENMNTLRTQETKE